MLSELALENYRCFERSSIPFKQLTIIVGANNAGKSTVVEALRLVSLVVNRLGRLPVHPVPDWLDVAKAYRGVRPSLEGQSLKFRGVFHQYNQPPARIVARFDNECHIEVYIGPEGALHAVCFDEYGEIASTPAQMNALQIGRIAILPQIGPLKDDETILTPDYVRKALDSNLASIHFRNQINLLYDSTFSHFKELSETTWQSLQINDLRGRGRQPGQSLELLVRNHEFVGEVSLMGHGLQMWLQTMWFIARALDAETLILDEPDVYMHADLQRRLIRFLRNKHPQLVIATHSIEIMGEVEPSNVLVVDRGRRKARFASDLASLDGVVNNIGGIHNLQLARLWNAKRCLVVEGDDVTILKRIEDVLFPDSADTLEVLPRISVGGWGNWQRVIGSAMLLEKNVGRDFITYCIFDRDYHIDAEIEERQTQAKKMGINLHIWQRKEIENYLICASAVSRLICSQSDKSVLPSDMVIQKELDRITDEMKDVVLDAFSQEYLSKNRSGGVSVANRFAREQLKDWNNPNNRLYLVSEKEVISRLSDWSKRKYNVSFAAETIASELRPNEIPRELSVIVTAIHDGEHFTASTL